MVTSTDQKLKKLQLELDSIQSELQWYANTSKRRNQIQREQSQGETRQAQLHPRIQSKKATLRRQQASIKKLNKQLHCWFNFLYWFDAREQQLRRKRRAEKAIATAVNRELTALQQQLTESKDKSTHAKNELQRLQRFDKTRAVQRQSKLKSDIRALEKKLASEQASRRATTSRTTATQPRSSGNQDLKRDIEQYQRELKQLARTIKQAEQFEAQLLRTSSSYDRKLVHDQCETQLGESSPDKLLRQLHSQRAKLARALDKAQQRQQTLLHDAAKARHYSTILVDGNNLCYDGSSNDFISIGILKAVTRQLVQRYKVQVIFDNSIMPLTRLSRGELIDQFESLGASVHVVQRGTRADTVLLRLARERRYAVLSNDNFSDYGDEAAVREERLIKHEIIASRHVIIPSLGIDLSL